ncbi:MAG: TIGR01777 family oxidoreductase [Bacteroidales bacterium]
MKEKGENFYPKGRVLITGSGGMTGKALTDKLTDNNWEVVHLHRGKRAASHKNLSYSWDPDSGYIDSAAFSGVTHIIHLAGAGIGDKRWSKRRKGEIVSSRIDTATLIFDTAMKERAEVKCFISASATGYYGNDTGSRILTEDSPAGTDFLALTCVRWEEAADMFRKSGIRTVKIRTGIVISDTGGFISRLMPLFKFRKAVWFGSGNQYFPWVHIDDLCNIYLRALDDNSIDGPFNAVAPKQVTQKEIIITMAGIIGKPIIKAGIPSFLVRFALGEMSSMLLTGNRVAATALEAAGFKWLYPSHETISLRSASPEP